jgi:hypothetical protein
MIVNKLQVQVVEDQRDSEPDHSLSESLADADPLPPEERSECHRVPLLSFRGQIPIRVFIEPLWDKQIRLSPLCFVMVDLMEHHNKDLPLLEQ